MDFETRGDFMQEVVVPRMNEIFAEASSTASNLPSSVDCSTCHGDDAEAMNFQMPNSLHPLALGEIGPMFESEDPEIRALAQFMAGPVEHEMAELLGLKPFDAETGRGFGCLQCHASK
ncbi:MAG: hypothetical protein ACRBN8_44695 [Nannocystales bacterium]